MDEVAVLVFHRVRRDDAGSLPRPCHDPPLFRIILTLFKASFAPRLMALIMANRWIQEGRAEIFTSVLHVFAKNQVRVALGQQPRSHQALKLASSKRRISNHGGRVHRTRPGAGVVSLRIANSHISTSPVLCQR